MGLIFGRCLDSWAAQQRQSKGKRCIEILKDTETHLSHMKAKYMGELAEIETAIAEGKSMSTSTPYERETRKTHLLELLRKRKTIRHYLSVAQRRNQQVLQKTLAVEALEVNSMQIDALKTTAKAFKAFSRQNGVEDLSNLEKASDVISDHMDALADIDSIMQESGKLPLQFEDMDDEEDLLKELEEWDDHKDGNAQEPSFSSVSMPDPPTQLPTGRASGRGTQVTVEQTLDKPVVLEMNAV